MYKESFYNIPKEIDGTRYIYNSFTKAFLKDINGKFQDSIAQIVEGLNNDDISMSNEVSQLINNGFICDAAFDERKALDFLFRKNIFDSSTLYLVLVPTMKCNFSCPYCFEASFKNMKTSKSYFKALGQYANKAFSNYNHIEISLFGGEPLLNAGNFLIFLSEVKALSLENKFSFSTSITTNGSLLTPEIMENLRMNNCVFMQITLDGDQKSHDNTRKFIDGRPSFDLLIDKINHLLPDYLASQTIRFALRINLNNNSVDEMEIALQKIDENIRNYINIFFRPVYQTKTYKENNCNTVFDLKGYYDLATRLGFRLMRNQHVYRSCEACGGENFLHVMPDLSLWKCINNLSRHEAEIGQLSENGDIELDANKLVNWYSSLDCFDDPICRDCKLLPDCFGACPLYKSVYGERLCAPFELVSLPYLCGEELRGQL